jgi:hypothetical protein
LVVVAVLAAIFAVTITGVLLTQDEDDGLLTGCIHLVGTPSIGGETTITITRGSPTAEC